MKTQFKCEVCGQYFQNMSGLSSHRRSHKAANYKCDSCTFTSKLKSSYEKHLQEDHNDEDSEESDDDNDGDPDYIPDTEEKSSVSRKAVCANGSTLPRSQSGGSSLGNQSGSSPNATSPVLGASLKRLHSMSSNNVKKLSTSTTQAAKTLLSNQPTTSESGRSRHVPTAIGNTPVKRSSQFDLKFAPESSGTPGMPRKSIPTFKFTPLTAANGPSAKFEKPVNASSRAKQSLPVPLNTKLPRSIPITTTTEAASKTETSTIKTGTTSANGEIPVLEIEDDEEELQLNERTYNPIAKQMTSTSNDKGLSVARKRAAEKKQGEQEEEEEDLCVYTPTAYPSVKNTPETSNGKAKELPVAINKAAKTKQDTSSSKKLPPKFDALSKKLNTATMKVFTEVTPTETVYKSAAEIASLITSPTVPNAKFIPNVQTPVLLEESERDRVDFTPAVTNSLDPSPEVNATSKNAAPTKKAETLNSKMINLLLAASKTTYLSSTTAVSEEIGTKTSGSAEDHPFSAKTASSGTSMNFQSVAPKTVEPTPKSISSGSEPVLMPFIDDPDLANLTREKTESENFEKSKQETVGLTSKQMSGEANVSPKNTVQTMKAETQTSEASEQDAHLIANAVEVNKSISENKVAMATPETPGSIYAVQRQVLEQENRNAELQRQVDGAKAENQEAKIQHENTIKELKEMIASQDDHIIALESRTREIQEKEQMEHENRNAELQRQLEAVQAENQKTKMQQDKTTEELKAIIASQDDHRIALESRIREIQESNNAEQLAMEDENQSLQKDLEEQKKKVAELENAMDAKNAAMDKQHKDDKEKSEKLTELVKTLEAKNRLIEKALEEKTEKVEKLEKSIDQMKEEVKIVKGRAEKEKIDAEGRETMAKRVLNKAIEGFNEKCDELDNLKKYCQEHHTFRNPNEPEMDKGELAPLVTDTATEASTSRKTTAPVTPKATEEPPAKKSKV